MSAARPIWYSSALTAMAIVRPIPNPSTALRGVFATATPTRATTAATIGSQKPRVFSSE